jgi:hypothetical protein
MPRTIARGNNDTQFKVSDTDTLRRVKALSSANSPMPGAKAPLVTR